MNPEAHVWLERFRVHLCTERRLSPHTTAAYLRDLVALEHWCERQGLAAWTQLNHAGLRAFAAASHARGLGARSIQRRLAAARTFFNYLLREQAVSHNPGVALQAPKAGARLPHTLDADLMGRLLDFTPASTLELRDLAIMELLYSSGLRLAEVVSLNLADLNAQDRTVRVLGKGGKTRIVPVGRKALGVLARWRSERTAWAGTAQLALFVGQRGRRLGGRAIQLRLAALARRRGIAQHVHPHLFRHSFATHLLESSRDLRGVQELLGHANIGTTQIYTHLDFQHLARTYERSHPRARRRG